MNQQISRADYDLERRVTLFVQNTQVVPPNFLEVHADRGVVTLAGKVNSPQQRKQLCEFARRVAGVLRLVEQLEVELPA